MKSHRHSFKVAQLLILTLSALKSSVAQFCSNDTECENNEKCCSGLVSPSSVKICRENCENNNKADRQMTTPIKVCNGGRSYGLFTAHVTWFQAIVECCKGDGMLVEVMNKNEGDFILAQSGQLGNKWFWIAAHSIDWRDGAGSTANRTFYWFGSKGVVDLSAFSYKSITNNKQGGSGTSESCLGSYQGTYQGVFYAWNDLPCQIGLPFICYYPKETC